MYDPLQPPVCLVNIDTTSSLATIAGQITPPLVSRETYKMTGLSVGVAVEVKKMMVAWSGMGCEAITCCTAITGTGEGQLRCVWRNMGGIEKCRYL